MSKSAYMLFTIMKQVIREKQIDFIFAFKIYLQSRVQDTINQVDDILDLKVCVMGFLCTEESHSYS